MGKYRVFFSNFTNIIIINKGNNYFINRVSGRGILTGLLLIIFSILLSRKALNKKILNIGLFLFKLYKFIISFFFYCRMGLLVSFCSIDSISLFCKRIS